MLDVARDRTLPILVLLLPCWFMCWMVNRSSVLRCSMVVEFWTRRQPVTSYPSKGKGRNNPFSFENFKTFAECLSHTVAFTFGTRNWKNNYLYNCWIFCTIHTVRCSIINSFNLITAQYGKNHSMMHFNRYDDFDSLFAEIT
jgi:hypothetical protein